MLKGFTGPIAYLTGEYPRATDTFIQREVAGLRAQGVEVSTYSIRKTGAEHLVGPEQMSEARQTFYILNAARNPFRMAQSHFSVFAKSPRRYLAGIKLAYQTAAPGWRAGLYQAFYFAEAAVLAHQIQRGGVLHLHNHIAKASCTVAMLAAKLAGISYSFTLHGPDIFFEPHRWRLDAKIAEASFVACISHYCRSQAMIFSAPDNWTKLHIVHCGVTPEKYSNNGKFRETKGLRLLFVGRLAGVKGLPVLFDALSKLKSSDRSIQLTLIGDGPERGSLERQVKAYGLASDVSFLGYKSQDEVAELLGQADALILPSFAEGVPVVLMEAMAAGLPVVTTKIAGIPELVEDGNSGFLVAPGDPAALRDALDKLCDDNPLRQKMGKAGRAKVISEFDVGKESAWLAELIASYCQGHVQPGLRPTSKAKDLKVQR